MSCRKSEIRNSKSEILITALPVTVVVLAVALTLSMACKRGDDPQFPHNTHVEMGVTCADCHRAPGVDYSYFDACSTCHDEGQEITMEQISVLAKKHRVQTKSFETTFDHAKHEGLACADCHSGKAAVMTKPKMDFCMTQCHGDKEVLPLGCRSCHNEIADDGKPLNHDATWKRAHGANAAVNKDKCAKCHDDNTCFSCHRISKPADHNQQWRLRGHGVISSMNRERCMSCHRQDECSRCHLSTQPISHTLAWKTPVSRHCQSCHLPLSANNCAACHDAANHNSAPAWRTDATHVTGASCRTCHIGPGQKLEHTDNGDDCESCHAK